MGCAVPAAVGLLGCWWIYSRIKKRRVCPEQRATGPRTEQQEEVAGEESSPEPAAGVPQRLPRLLEEERPETENAGGFSAPCQPQAAVAPRALQLAAAEDSASGTDGASGERSSAVRDGGRSQRPQAGPVEAAEGSQCPICLQGVTNATYVAYCLHSFCFGCIQRWATMRNTCPVCRQPLERLLISGQADDMDEELVLSPSNHVCRWTLMGRPCRRFPQQRYYLRRRITSRSQSPAGRDAATDTLNECVSELLQSLRFYLRRLQ
ncbi:E3 ubiquitin-protein ligase Topors-like [Cuculus canorus]|nr:E3 ubiquitin-protein ligase Topors-like [Cuculus canorus]